MTGWVWLLTAAAVTAWPSGRAAGTGERDTTVPPAVSVRSRRRVLTVVTVAVVAAGCLAVGGTAGVLAAVVLVPSTVAVLRREAGRAGTAPPDRTTALALDLAAAVLRAGRPVPDALALAAPAAQGPAAARLERTARLLALGADPAQAWREAGPALAPVAQVAVRSQSSGVRLADAFERLAADLRTEAVTVAITRAQRTGVQAMGPLAACFLPSFVCLGIVPVVAGVAATVGGSLGG